MKQQIGVQTICGVRVPIFRADVADAPMLRDEDTGETLDGRFDGEKGVIYVRRGLSRTLERDALNHEILHALLAYSGARSFLAGLARGMSSDHEETLMRILAPHMHALRWAK